MNLATASYVKTLLRRRPRLSASGLVSLFSLCLAANVQGQTSFWEPADSLHRGRLTFVATTAAVGYTAAMVGLDRLWYSDQPRGSFRFYNDNADWLQIDKAGHALSAYHLSRLSYQAIRWTGSREERSVWAGTGFAMLFMMGFEVLDGFSAAYGFSPGDAAANIGGAALFAGQQLGWGEQRIMLKFSYGSSGLAHYRPELLGSTPIERLLKDYNGHTYWLSANPASFAPGRKTLLPWLNLAFGYGANGMLGSSANPSHNAAGEALPDMNRYRQYYLSLDIDFQRIRTQSAFLRTLFSLINVVKVPAPSIEWSQGSATWHWMFF